VTTTILTLLLALQAPPLSREQERRILQEAVSQVGNSPVDFIRASERHLKKYPQSTLREDLERAIARAAIDAKDRERTVRYGEMVLARSEDTTLLDNVARALLDTDDRERARKALGYAERLEKFGASEGAQLVARAQVLQARALGNLGEIDKAIAKALQSYQTYPSGEAAREAARWELRAGRTERALEHYADAFSIPDPKVTAENREHHRQVMGELNRKLRGSEAGLGDLILKAYDRTAADVKRREAAARKTGPNQDVQDAFEFRLSGLRGDSLRLADLKGKILVLDFWATWCVPCRVQHPILEQVKWKYRTHRDVAFVSIATDDNRAAVRPFVEELKWSDQVYFEDGLARFYRITSIPTLMVFNRRGELVSRLPGFVPEQYEQMVVEKIEEAREEGN
jgi:thiol-disulfide isomerase/thioredoxin